MKKYLTFAISIILCVSSNAANWLTTYGNVGTPASGDAFVLQDVSDPTSQPYGTTKYILWSTFTSTFYSSGSTPSFVNGDFTGTEALKIPVGNTAQRPAVPVNGDFRINSQTGNTEIYRDSAWRNLEDGIAGLTATSSELNLLDLTGLTVNWVLSADSATTASWKAPTGGAADGDGLTITDLAGGTALAVGNKYFDTFAANRTFDALPAGSDGDRLVVVFEVTGATRTLDFHTNTANIRRTLDGAVLIAAIQFPVGYHRFELLKIDGEWWLNDTGWSDAGVNSFIGWDETDNEQVNILFGTGFTYTPATNTLSVTSSGMALDTIWDAVGDLAVGTGSDTGGILSLGNPLEVLRVNAGGTNIEWAAPAGGGLGANLSSSTNDIISDTATTGAIVLGGSTGAAEQLTLDFGTAANTIALSSTTGAHLDTSAMGLAIKTGSSGTGTQGIYFANDTNTGIYGNDSDYIFFMGDGFLSAFMHGSSSVASLGWGSSTASGRYFAHTLGTMNTEYISGTTAGSGFGVLANNTTGLFYVRAHASQAGNLQEWRNNGGTAQSYVTATGSAMALGMGTVAGTFTMGDGSGNFASFTVPALGANTVYTLPTTDGDAGQFFQTNGAGVLTWASPGSGGLGSELASTTNDITTSNAGDEMVLAGADEALTFDFDTVVDNQISLSSTTGADYLGIVGMGIGGTSIAEPLVRFNVSSSATTPTIHPRSDDTDTGIGAAGADVVSIITGGKQTGRFSDGELSISAPTLNDETNWESLSLVMDDGGIAKISTSYGGTGVVADQIDWAGNDNTTRIKMFLDSTPRLQGNNLSIASDNNLSMNMSAVKGSGAFWILGNDATAEYNGSDFESSMATIQMKLNQTAAAGYDVLRLRAFETSLGSGFSTGNNLIRAQSGAAGNTTQFRVDRQGSIFLREKASASASVAAFGQIWSKDTTPSQLWFTNDAGTDFQLGLAGGDVTGPGSSTDNAIATFDSTTGKIIQQNHAITISDAGVIAGGSISGTDVTLTNIPTAELDNPVTDLGADAVNALTEISQSIKTSADDSSALVVGTAGATNRLASWDAGGALIDSGSTIADLAAFSGLTGGTNTAAAMVVGTGASLSASGSGTITATTNANLTGPVTSTGNATAIANDAITDIMVSNTLTASLFVGSGSTTTNIDTGEITDGTIDFADINATATLASNPALGVNRQWFGNIGMIFEGPTDDAFEGLLTSAVASSDKTWTLPNLTGTVALTNATQTFSGTTLFTGVVTQSNAANVFTGASYSGAGDTADAGVFRLANAGIIGWEASPTGTDVTLTVNTSEQFVFSDPILSPVLVTPTLTSPIFTEAAIGALDIDWATATTFTKTLSANSTFTFSNLVAGKTINVALTNTASNYTVTWPTVLWSGGSAPVQTIGAKTDVYTFIRIGSTTYGSVVQNF